MPEQAAARQAQISVYLEMLDCLGGSDEGSLPACGPSVEDYTHLFGEPSTFDYAIEAYRAGVRIGDKAFTSPFDIGDSWGFAR